MTLLLKVMMSKMSSKTQMNQSRTDNKPIWFSAQSLTR